MRAGDRGRWAGPGRPVLGAPDPDPGRLPAARLELTATRPDAGPRPAGWRRKGGQAGPRELGVVQDRGAPGSERSTRWTGWGWRGRILWVALAVRTECHPL